MSSPEKLTCDTESRTAWSVVHSCLPEVLDPGPGQANHDGQKDEGDGGTESRTAWSVVHSCLPEVLDPGPGEANHDGQKDEGDGGYREQDSLDCGT